ncbi:MAG TPA: hypothetical protein DHW14_02090 [Clostridiales bacterium]|nr:hypothetical protein [Clostridiales bacterium]
MNQLTRTAAIVVAVALVISLLLNAWALVRVAALKKELVSLESQTAARITELEHEVDALRAEIARSREPDWLTWLDESFDLSGYREGEPLEVTVTWGLLELDPGSDVSIVCVPAGDDGGTDVVEVEALHLGGLTYSATLRLDPERDWVCQIVGTVDGTRKASGRRLLDLRRKLSQSYLVVEPLDTSGGFWTYLVRQDPLPPLEPYRIARVEAEYSPGDGTRTAAEVTPQGDGQWLVTLPEPAGKGALYLTLTFENGHVDTVVLAGLDEVRGREAILDPTGTGDG